MASWLHLWLRVLVGSTGVFGGLFVVALAFWAMERAGVYGLAVFTGVLTWAVLALVGLALVVGMFAENLLADLELRRQFWRWYVFHRSTRPNTQTEQERP